MRRFGGAAPLLLAFFLLASCRTMQSAEAPVQAQAEVSAQRDGHAKTWNDGDHVGWSNHFAPDGRFMGALSNRVVDGRAAIAGHFAQTFQTYTKRQYEWINPQVRFYGDTAVEMGMCRMKMSDATGRDRTLEANYSITRVKRDGQWQIVSMHTSPRASQ